MSCADCKKEKAALKKRAALTRALFLYAVTDSHWLNGRSLTECVRAALRGGASFVQLREKDCDYETFFREAVELKKLCSQFRAPFVINDNVELAKKIDADGVHVGQGDMACIEARAILGKNKIIGVSAATVEEAIRAEKDGADYLGVGAVFKTGSKADAGSVSRETLKEICAAVRIPVVAIGGISADNVHELGESGIAGISVISAIFASDNIRAAAARLAQKTRAIL